MSDLWHTAANIESGTNHLRVSVAWNTNISHLGPNPMMREVVEYTRRDERVFDWSPNNPSINRPYTPAFLCRAPDVHIMPRILEPLRAGRWVAFQQYQLTLDESEREWIDLTPSYSIVREIYQQGGGWFYRITKRSYGYEANGRLLNLNFDIRLLQGATSLRQGRALSRVV